jgi:hypothetical protein
MACFQLKDKQRIDGLQSNNVRHPEVESKNTCANMIGMFFWQIFAAFASFFHQIASPILFNEESHLTQDHLVTLSGKKQGYLYSSPTHFERRHFVLSLHYKYGIGRS